MIPYLIFNVCYFSIRRYAITIGNYFGFCFCFRLFLLDDIKNINAKIRLAFQNILCIFLVVSFKGSTEYFIRSSEFLIIFNGIESLGLGLFLFSGYDMGMDNQYV